MEEPELQTFYIHITDRGGRGGAYPQSGVIYGPDPTGEVIGRRQQVRTLNTAGTISIVSHRKPRPLWHRRAQTYGAVEVDAGDSCVTAGQGTFGLTATCTRSR